MDELREYQHDFSADNTSMHDVVGRERKAATMVAVLNHYFKDSLSNLQVLDVGASTGIIDNYLANHFGSVIGMDIDQRGIDAAGEQFSKRNLQFMVGDAMDTGLSENSVDVVICSQVYEHVPDSMKMMEEIYRILRPAGICYFAASNRIMWNEPHYNLPLLSVIPRPLAHWYVRLSGKATRYHELHYSYWGLMKLIKRVQLIDYTARMIEDPTTYSVEYMLAAGSGKQSIAKAMLRYAYWLVPGYIWLLRKPGELAK